MQPDLFSTPFYQRHSTTSLEAAQSMRPERINDMHKRILDYLKTHPSGATDETMGDTLEIAPNTLRPRRRELQLWGHIKDSGHTEPAKSGRRAVIWTIV